MSGQAPLQGNLDGRGMHMAIAAARWNEFIVERLLAGATSTLSRLGVDPEAVDVVWVPGAFELPLAAQRLATSDRYDAVITLGAVIRGATGHYELVAGNCASGIARVALETGVPVVFGVLATDTIEQAIERAGTKAGNKGSEAAAAAVEMADLLRRLPGAGAPAGNGATTADGAPPAGGASVLGPGPVARLPGA